MTPNDRTGPGVCPRCGDARIIPIGDGYSVNPCPNCTGQRPRRPDVCPLCGNCVTCNGERVVEGTNANAGTWSPCPTCRDPQPAQPGSGEVVPRSRYNAANNDWLDEKAAHEKTRQAAADEIDRLQSALTTAKAYSDDMEARYHTAHERLTAAQQRVAALENELENERARGIHTCHDQCQRPLCVAQREIAAITAMAQAQRDCKPPYTSWSPAGMHQMLVQLHDLILKEPS